MLSTCAKIALGLSQFCLPNRDLRLLEPWFAIFARSITALLVSELVLSCPSCKSSFDNQKSFPASTLNAQIAKRQTAP